MKTEEKKLLIRRFIWNNEKGNDKPFDVLLEHSPTTVLSLGWFDKNYELTEKGKQQIEILKHNENRRNKK